MAKSTKEIDDIEVSPMNLFIGVAMEDFKAGSCVYIDFETGLLRKANRHEDDFNEKYLTDTNTWVVKNAKNKKFTELPKKIPIAGYEFNVVFGNGGSEHKNEQN